jgi:RHS repeat-associated protein
MQTNAAGGQEEVCSSYPFGDGLSCTGTDATEQHFTGKVRDAESGLDYFGGRHLNTDLGRWMKPEYSVSSVIMEIPQTWNKYDYEHDRPTYGTDPNGYCPPCVGAIIGGIVEGGIDAGEQFFRNGNSFKGFSWSEFGGAVGGGAVVGALAGATGGTSLLANAVVGDLAAGTTSSVVGGVATRGLTSLFSGGKGSGEILSGGEISKDAVLGFVGAGPAHLAGDYIHVPDDPVYNGTGITEGAATNPSPGQINYPLYKLGISTVAGSLASHGAEWMIDEWPANNYVAPPSPYQYQYWMGNIGGCPQTIATDSQGQTTGWSGCQ